MGPEPHGSESTVVPTRVRPNGIVTIWCTGSRLVTKNESGAASPDGGRIAWWPASSSARITNWTDPDSEPATARAAGALRSNVRSGPAGKVTERHPSAPTRVDMVTEASHARPPPAQTTCTGIRTRSPARARTGDV